MPDDFRYDVFLSHSAKDKAVVRPLAEVEKLAIEHALSVCSGNKTLAAKQLGISRQTLRTKLKDYALGDDPEEANEEG